MSLINASTGVRYVYDGVSGGSLIAIDATSNQMVAAIGTLPAGNATGFSGTFRGSAHTGFLEATNILDAGPNDTRFVSAQFPGRRQSGPDHRESLSRRILASLARRAAALACGELSNFSAGFSVRAWIGLSSWP